MYRYTGSHSVAPISCCRIVGSLATHQHGTRNRTCKSPAVALRPCCFRLLKSPGTVSDRTSSGPRSKGAIAMTHSFGNYSHPLKSGFRRIVRALVTHRSCDNCSHCAHGRGDQFPLAGCHHLCATLSNFAGGNRLPNA